MYSVNKYFEGNNKVSMIFINENIGNLHHIYSTFLVKKNHYFLLDIFFRNGTISGGGGVARGTISGGGHNILINDKKSTPSTSSHVLAKGYELGIDT